MGNNGKQSYVSKYTPSLLESVPRKNQRQSLGIKDHALPFTGRDTWNAYEFTWLNRRGKPEVALARFQVPGDSPNLIESRSMKFYLGSYSNTSFDHPNKVIDTLASDLTKAAGALVDVSLLTAAQVENDGMGLFTGVSLDDLDIDIDEYNPDADLLAREGSSTVRESVYTHLFRSLCPITGQPDFASIHVQYDGNRMSHEGLLRYLVSYRQHPEFAEQVTERIFIDIMNRCEPGKLTVNARYTRRGGIDINSCRTNEQALPSQARLWRQ